MDTKAHKLLSNSLHYWMNNNMSDLIFANIAHFEDQLLISLKNDIFIATLTWNVMDQYDMSHTFFISIVGLDGSAQWSNISRFTTYHSEGPWYVIMAVYSDVTGNPRRFCRGKSSNATETKKRCICCYNLMLRNRCGISPLVSTLLLDADSQVFRRNIRFYS